MTAPKCCGKQRIEIRGRVWVHDTGDKRMAAPAILKRYKFFSVFDATELEKLAALARDVSVLENAVIFAEQQTANALYFLLDGEVDLYTTVSATNPTRLFAGEINPGDPFGVSALLEPYVYRTSARALVVSRFLELDAQELRALMERDCALGMKLLRQMMRATLERVEVLRLHVAALSKPRDAEDD
jgi:CRP-like cAMP-binding protein